MATLGRDKRSLSAAAFRPPATAPCWLSKPGPEDPTMAPAAHSAQVGYEECLLACKVRNGCFVRTAHLKRSWACALVHTISTTAKELYQPSVLAHVKWGQAFLIFLGCSRCLWGWPLTVLDADRCILGLDAMNKMVSLIVTDPCPLFLNFTFRASLRQWGPIGVSVAVAAGVYVVRHADNGSSISDSSNSSGSVCTGSMFRGTAHSSIIAGELACWY